MGRPAAGTPERESGDGRSSGMLGVTSRVTPDIAAEAALWVARLHGPDRNRAMEREFQAWQARSPAHREAFGRCTEVWQDVPRLKLADAYETAASLRTSPEVGAFRGPAWRWAAGLTAVLVGSALILHWQAEGSYSTAIGEQRLVVLDDGSRMLLNTATRVRVDFGSTQRRIEVTGGEALFEVAKNPSRPFVVRVAGSEVVATGTVFAVRFTAGSSRDEAVGEVGPRNKAGVLAVTLLEGQVHVRPSETRGGGDPGSNRDVVLRPGDRLQLDQSAANRTASASSLDRPNVEQLIAWKRREVVFEEALLGDAVEEMNRYNRTPVVLLDDLRTSRLRLSGVYRTGDGAGFARAVAALHGLHVRERDDRLELTGGS